MTESYVVFPPEFIATKYPGYFFNLKDKKLYSMKIDGILKPLKFQKPNNFNPVFRQPFRLKKGGFVTVTGGYCISVKGRSRTYPIEELMELEPIKSVIPIK